jgi:hypothetical protein
MSYFPRQRKISVCTACGDRAMSISDDGGDTWTCNRCTVAYGIGRERLYDDPAIANQKIVADHPVYGDNVTKTPTPSKIEVPKPEHLNIETQPEVKSDDKPRKTKRKPAEKAT